MSGSFALRGEVVVIFRLAPGETAPWSGTYPLFGHYGERTGRLVSVKCGDQLPLAQVKDDIEMWFVLENESDVATSAA